MIGENRFSDKGEGEVGKDGKKGIIDIKGIQFIVISLSIFSAFLFMRYIYGIDTTQSNAFVQWLYSSNVKIYTAMIAVFAMSFLILNILSGTLLKKGLGGVENKLSTKVQLFIVTGISLIGFCLFAEYILVEQFKEIGVVNGNFDNFPLGVKIVSITLVFVWMSMMYCSNSDSSKYTLWIVYLVTILITFLLFYIPNQFCINDGDDFLCDLTRHVPCMETIYNVADGVPYNINTSGLYGHYGLFFALPLRILGIQDLRMLAFLLAFSACIAQIATLYVIHTFLPFNWMKVIFSMASIIFLNFYFAGCFPIRTFCPAVMCGFITYLYKNHNKILRTKWLLIGTALCSLCLIWNFEMGFACAIGFSVYAAFELLQDKDVPRFKSFLGASALLIGISCIAILGAITIVNIYNLIVGGRPIFRVFFYPLIKSAENYMLDLNRDNVPFGNHLWVYVVILLFGSLGYALYDTHLFHKKNVYRKKSAVIAGIAATGIVVFSYYINEAHWGAVFIVHQVAVALCAVIMSEIYVGISEWRGERFIDQVRKAGMILIVGIVSIYALRTVNIPIVLREMKLSGAYYVDGIKAEMENMANIVPENTYGVGCGVNIIYHTLGWDNHAKYRDTTALKSSSDVTYEVVINEIMNQEAFVINMSNDAGMLADILGRVNDFELINTFQIGPYQYGYYCRK